MIGGLLEKERQAIHGRMAEEHISSFSVDKAFLGADGVSLDFGLSAKSEVERGNTPSMMKASLQNFFILDSAKFEKNALLQISGSQEVDKLITDNKLDDELLDRHREADIDIDLSLVFWSNEITKRWFQPAGFCRKIG